MVKSNSGTQIIVGVGLLFLFFLNNKIFFFCTKIPILGKFEKGNINFLKFEFFEKKLNFFGVKFLGKKRRSAFNWNISNPVKDSLL